MLFSQKFLVNEPLLFNSSLTTRSHSNSIRLDIWNSIQTESPKKMCDIRLKSESHKWLRAHNDRVFLNHFFNIFICRKQSFVYWANWKWSSVHWLFAKCDSQCILLACVTASLRYPCYTQFVHQLISWLKRKQFVSSKCAYVFLYADLANKHDNSQFVWMYLTD